MPSRDTDEDVDERVVAARCRFDSGDYAAARAAAEAVAADFAGSLRAESLLLRAVVARCDGRDDDRELLAAALLVLSL